MADAPEVTESMTDQEAWSILDNIEGSEKAQGTGDAPDGQQNESGNGGETLSLTSSQLKERLERAGESTRRQILSDLGFEDFDSLKSLVAAQRQAEEAQKSELQKITEERDALKKQHEELRASFARQRQEASLKDALIAAGVKPERAQAALRLADAGKLSVDESSGEIGGLEEAVSAVKESAPEFFGQGAPRTAPDASPRPTQPVDFSRMSKEEFDALQRRVLAGESVQVQ